MTTATVDITDLKKISKDESDLSKLTTAVGLELEKNHQPKTDSNYYYSSGSFKFILDKGFKPETLEVLQITPIPFLPDWNMGIVSIHGVIMPVIDILKFIKSQNIDVTEKTNTDKSYLLKLEHKDFSPIVFSIDSLPQLISTEDYEVTDIDNNSTHWIKSYLCNKTTSIAFIDHQKLFDLIVNSQ